MSNKSLYWASTALVTCLFGATAANAQSTGTEATEAATTVQEVVVTGARGPRTTDGTLVAETVAKTRSTVTQEFIETQAAGQTIIQTLNLTPGVNFTNSDPYGSSGGNLRIRGFDGNRISLTFDGIPLNDTGNYAIYSNQQMDPELIERASVNQGTTDVDSPTASATGGTINYSTRRPGREFGVLTQGSIGSFDYRRIFGMVDTGEIGPWDTRAFFAGSWQNYNKFKGPGDLDKRQFNARIFQDLGDGDFASLSFHYNRNRNNFYRNLNLAQFTQGQFVENDIYCGRPAGVNGTAQNESTGSTIINYLGVTSTGSCTNYHDTRINPSDTGNIRGQLSYGITDNLRLTVDPSFQYTIANGGGFTTLAETDDRLDQGVAASGRDLNGDADFLDTVMIYTPSNTNTRRYGLTSSLIWDITDAHRIRAAYTWDYGRHRQTGEASRYDAFGNPASVYGGKEGWGDEGARILGNDGSFYRSRDRFSIAALNQLALEYRGKFLDDALTITIGARAPFFKRELNQYCFSQNGSSTVRCTTEPSTASPALTGAVRFASTGTTEWLRPYEADVEFDDILPNVGANWNVTGNHWVYASYAEGLSAPRTDFLYQPVLISGSLRLSNAVPETTKSYDLGYRYQSSNFLASVALWSTEYSNRIVSAFDEQLGISIDRNVGEVELQGIDAQVGWEPIETLSLYASASFTESELQRDVPLSATTFLPTKGRSLVETPDWTYAVRASWDATERLSLGLQGKWVSDRFSTDVNDEIAPGYRVFDFDARYDLDQIFNKSGTFLQLNVINLFDEKYLGNISSQTNAKTIDVDPTAAVVNRSGSTPTYSLGAPRTIMLSLRARF